MEHYDSHRYLVLNQLSNNPCYYNSPIQKQPPKGVLEKRCSENMQQIYRRAHMPNCDFNKVAIALRHGCSPVDLRHIFRTAFPRNTPGWLLPAILAVALECQITSPFVNLSIFIRSSHSPSPTHTFFGIPA